MPDSKDSSASSPKSPTDANLVNSKSRSWLTVLFLSAMIPVVAAMVVYHLDSFDAAPMPLHELSQPPQRALLREGRPSGRLLSFDPVSKRTKVLLSDLYFANGIALSPEQDYLLFCETPMRRCRKYYIQGIKEGHVENFIDNLPGMPDNIRYDGEGHYWIALFTEYTMFWDIASRYPLVRKAVTIVDRLIGGVNMVKNSGLFVVDMDGKPVAQYQDVELKYISTGMKIKNHLYCGSVCYPYIIRLNLDQHAAKARP
ncbi:hypothetical protein DITRI_Ditri18aG0124000 [Diplodiscus trichospermus]